MRKRASALFGLLLALSSSVVGQESWAPSDADKQRAEQSVREYLKALADARFGDAYAMLTPSMRQSVPADLWSQREKQFAQVSGGSPRYSNVRATWYKDPGDAPLPGVYVAFDLDCRYANIDLCHQTLMLHQQSDSSFQVMRHERAFMDRQNESAIRQRESAPR
jgi:hypothetical protein